jgi:hypothetical protein
VRNRLWNSWRWGWRRIVCHRAVVMKWAGEIKAQRLSVRDEHKFVKERAPSPAREPRALPRMGTKQNAQWKLPSGILFWRRPTLARPFAVLPSGLQRFTSVFGMGTGGATTLRSPECGTALAVGCCRSDASTKPSLWGLQDSNFERTRFSIGIRKSKIFSDSLTSTYRFSETLSAFAKATA